MRLKVRLTIQKEVAPGAMQKPLDCEFVVRNQQCTDCRQQFENFAWTAVQVRQRVSLKRTFFYLEQSYTKEERTSAAVKIEQFRDAWAFLLPPAQRRCRICPVPRGCVPCRVLCEINKLGHDLIPQIEGRLVAFPQVASKRRKNL